ncbi:MAG: hypothetical protein HWE23_07600 [Rhodobacteraceae bacterium]|nr:hypothetical protein [Paracoccaceae bacterium]
MAVAAKRNARLTGLDPFEFFEDPCRVPGDTSSHRASTEITARLPFGVLLKFECCFVVLAARPDASKRKGAQGGQALPALG